MNLTRTNLVTNGCATIAGLLTQFAVILLLARTLPASVYAEYLLAAAAIAIGEMCSDFGARMWAAREYALGAPFKSTMVRSYQVKMFYSLLCGLGAGVLARPEHRLWQQALIVLISFTQPSTDPLLWCFRGRDRVYVEAIITLIWRIALASAICAAAIYLGPVIEILAVWLAVNVARLVLEHTFLESRLPPPDGSTSREYSAISFPELVAKVFPVGAAFVIMSVYQRVGVFLLAKISTSDSVATYGTAFTLVNVPGFLSVTISTVYFPMLARVADRADRVTVKQTFDRGIVLVGSLYALAAVVGVPCVPWFTTRLFPQHLEGIATITQLLLPGLYISTLNVYLKYCLNALGRNIIDAVASALGIAIFAIVVLVPEWDRAAQGAAIAWNIGELAIFVLRTVAIHRDGRIPVATAAMLGCGYPVLCALCYGLAT